MMNVRVTCLVTLIPKNALTLKDRTIVLVEKDTNQVTIAKHVKVQ